MRFDGTLKTWNAERGFGFITPRTGGQDIFIHISAFPRGGHPPREGEVLTFEVESTPEGKKRAVRVRRPGQASAAHTAERRPRVQTRVGAGGGWGPGRVLLTLAIAAGLGWYAYGMYERDAGVRAMGTQTLSGEPLTLSGFHCDGRTRCSQMTSCAEARFFLQNCPGTQMDGNNDGVPCQQQWCTGP